MHATLSRDHCFYKVARYSNLGSGFEDSQLKMFRVGDKTFQQLITILPSEKKPHWAAKSTSSVVAAAYLYYATVATFPKLI